MRRIRAHPALPVLAALGLALLLPACQTSESPTERVAFGGASNFAAPLLPPGPGRKVAERKGWVVEAVTATVTEPAHCRVSRPGDSGPKLSFQAAPGSFSVLIGTPDRLLAPGASYDVDLAFDGAATESHKAQALDSGTLAVRIRSLDYEDITDAFVRAKSMTASSLRLGGRIAAFPLTGSNWAVNALDECRRIHTRS